MCTVNIQTGSRTSCVSAIAGETVLAILQRTSGLFIDAPCGGNGTCGKCVVALRGRVSAPGETEIELLGGRRAAQRRRLACFARIEGDCTILLPQADTVPQTSPGAQGGTQRPVADPVISIDSVTLGGASLDDQRDRTKRLAAVLGIQEAHFDRSMRVSLAEAAVDAPLTVIRTERRVIELSTKPGPQAFGIAADVGTSTVVLYLLDMANGEVIGSASAPNAQKPFGADVISRIAHASEGTQNLHRLQDRIVQQIAELSDQLARSHGGSSEEIVLATIAGNTTMLHLLAGVSPAGIAAAPFIPVFTDSFVLSAAEIGLGFHRNAEVRLLPSVAAYVGADIVAGILSTGLDRARGPVLLVDLGTNCEVVLGNRERIVACATAAGPAFEGAQIECGIGGVRGAIRRVWFADGLEIETVASVPPVGICGSGILDTVAVLLECGVVDASGRMRSPAEDSEPTTPELRELLLPPRDDGKPLRFLLAGVDDEHGRGSGPGRLGGARDDATRSAEPGRREIYFSQKDVREVQLAKAAIGAGIEVLAARFGIGVDEIERVYLSGAFGSAMSPASACTIGLLPCELRDRSEGAGNTSGRGVVMAARSLEDFARCDEIRRRVEYIELSSDPEFRDAYVEHMMFPPLRAAPPSSQRSGASTEGIER